MFFPLFLHFFQAPDLSFLFGETFMTTSTVVMFFEFYSFLSFSHKVILHGKSQGHTRYREYYHLGFTQHYSLCLLIYLFVRKGKVHLALFVSSIDIIRCFIIYHFSCVFVPSAIGLLWINCIQNFPSLPSFIYRLFQSHSP